MKCGNDIILTDKTKPRQQARAQLRESFLTAVQQLGGEPCKVLTFEKTLLPATFSVWKPDGSKILVRDLGTPSGVVVQSALLRTSDVLAVQFDKSVNS